MPKKPKKDLGPYFTGGDHFTGFEKIVHHLMMQNELKNGYGAYKVSFAGAKSGLSFGGNQMDMRKNQAHADLFTDILKNSTNHQGEKIFQAPEILTIVGRNNIRLQDKGKTPQAVFGGNLDRVNSALSSTYGIKTINAAYINAIPNGISHVEKAIHLMKNPAAKTFYSTDFGKALLFDYNNQYNLAFEGTFMLDYIDGFYNKRTRTVVATNEQITAPTNTYDLSNHQQFMRSTLQWAHNKTLVDDRLTHSVTLLKKHGLCDKCSVGQHYVKAHIVHYSPSTAHPTGLNATRVAHCAKNPIKTTSTEIA